MKVWNYFILICSSHLKTEAMFDEFFSPSVSPDKLNTSKNLTDWLPQIGYIFLQTLSFHPVSNQVDMDQTL